MKEQHEYNDRSKIEDQRLTEAEEQKEAQKKADDKTQAGERRNDIKRMEKLKERRIQDQQQHQLTLVQLMHNMFQGTSVHPPPEPSIPHVPTKLPYPPLSRTHSANQTTPTPPSASKRITNEIEQIMKKTKLGNDNNDSTKKRKQNNNMYLHDP